MLHRFIQLAGLLLGLGLALLAGGWLGLGQQEPELPTGQLLSDCEGPIRQVVIQYHPDGLDIVATPYQQFLSKLRKDIEVIVVVQDKNAWQHFQQEVGDFGSRVRPCFTGVENSCWSRDRWIALADQQTTWLVASREEQAANQWPIRAADSQIGKWLAVGLKDIRFHRSRLLFDGGDLVCDSRTVFLSPTVIRRNIGASVRDRRELITAFEKLTGKKAVLLDGAPDYHAGMYLMAIGNNRVIVGDPSLADEQSIRLAKQSFGKVAVDHSDIMQQRFDAVAAKCQEAGYEVLRIPTVAGADQRTFVSYVNVVIDQVDSQPVVYMPVYDGLDDMNQRAGKVWESAGYRVVPINCTSTYRYFGSLRCLVSVSRRG